MDPPPPMENGPPSIPTLMLLHTTLILLRIMYIAFPNLKVQTTKCRVHVLSQRDVRAFPQAIRAIFLIG